MRLQRLLLIGSLATAATPRYVAGQTESPSRSFLIYVTPTAEQHYYLSPSEHLLIFRIPVQVPGASLPPGPYIFRLVTPSLLQVMNESRSTVYSTFFTLSASGDGDSGRERIRLAQNPEDDVPRIVGWYLPGGIGYEFTYPTPKRQRAQRERAR
jgi:hypothetical protein